MYYLVNVLSSQPSHSASLRLGGLRTQRNRTQADVAASIGTTQSAVSRIERQHDLLVSTLADFVGATGGSLHLIARYDDEEVELEIPALRPVSTSLARSLRVIWQDPVARSFVHVGTLRVKGEHFSFEYTPAARTTRSFEPFSAFPDRGATYRSSKLFPFFAARVPVAPRGHDSLRISLGLSRAEATPVELLARTAGISAHDTLQVVPEPTIDDGHLTCLFLASGVSHANDEDPRVQGRVARLAPGAELSLVDEPANPHNPRAILLCHGKRTLGWVPDYMVDEIHRLRSSAAEMAVTVEHANGPDAPWHLRLLCRLQATI